LDILITGSNGFLGTLIKKEFYDYNIFDLNRNNGSYHCSLQNEVPVFHQIFDLIVHSAGKAHVVPRSESEKKEFYDVNVLGTLNLLRGLEKSGLPKMFVFISSVAVYGQEIGNDISEEHALLAKDPYGLSKIEAEKLIQKWCEDNNIICSILRLPLLVGKRPPGNLGAMIKAIQKGYYFNIGGGKAKKSMVLAKDIPSFILKVATIGGIYNLTDGVNPSFSELSREISIKKKHQFNLPLSLARIIGKFGDVLGNKSPINSLKVKKITSDLTFNDSKARKFLDWNPEPVLDYLKRENLY